MYSLTKWTFLANPKFSIILMMSTPVIKSKLILLTAAAAAAAKSLQSCLTLCNPRDGSPPGSAIPGILQARTLEWVAISFPNAWKWKVKVKSLSRVQLSVSSIHGIFQARVLEWGAIAFSLGRLKKCHFCLMCPYIYIMLKSLSYNRIVISPVPESWCG